MEFLAGRIEFPVKRLRDAMVKGVFAPRFWVVSMLKQYVQNDRYETDCARVIVPDDIDPRVPGALLIYPPPSSTSRTLCHDDAWYRERAMRWYLLLTLYSTPKGISSDFVLQD